jgi:selenocysteine lyase/cysteine desulfurase
VAGLAAGIRFILEEGMERLHKHEVGLTERLRGRLLEIDGCETFGHEDPSRRVGVLSFRVAGQSPLELGSIFDGEFDIAVRPGLHCAPYIHRTQGTFPDGTVRVSPGPFNTEEDVDQVAQALGEIVG